MHLKGLPRSKIAAKTGLSTGSVSNIIKSWENISGITDLHVIRGFMKEVYKTGLNIKQLASLLPLLNMLEEFSSCENDPRNDVSKDKLKEILSFMDELCQACKDQDIRPSSIPIWMRDYKEFVSEHEKDLEAINTTPNKNSLERDPEPFSSPPDFHLGLSDKSSYQHPEIVDKSSTFNSKISENIIQHNSDSQNTNFPEKSIPLISDFYSYLEILKDQYTKLKKTIQRQKIILTELEQEETILNSSIELLKIEESEVMELLDWYNQSKTELKESYGIDINDIKNFARLINEFSNRGYDINKILQEYSKVQSLRSEKILLKQEVEKYLTEINGLKSSYAFYQYQIQDYKDQIDALNFLEKMGIGYNELMLYVMSIQKIAGNKKITYRDATKLFHIDIQDRFLRHSQNIQFSWTDVPKSVKESSRYII